jgi:hypothetical protein
MVNTEKYRPIPTGKYRFGTIDNSLSRERCVVSYPPGLLDRPMISRDF